MSTSFSPNYTEPGVYIQYQNIVLPSAPPGIFIPVIIGQGSKTVNVPGENVIKGTPDGMDALVHTPVFIISAVTDNSGHTYIQGTDYQLTGNNVDWSLAGSEPVTGSTYFVTYTYIKGTADYAPFLTTDLNSVINTFGPARFAKTLLTGTATGGSSTTITTGLTLVTDAYKGQYAKIVAGTNVGEERLITGNTSGGVFTVSPAYGSAIDATSVFQINDVSTNTASMGATICMNAGASYIMVVQIVDDETQPWKDAIDKLKSQYCYCIVLMKGLSGSDPLVTYLEAHVNAMSAVLERKFRTAIVGAPINTTSPSTFISYAKAVDYLRMAYLVPSNQVWTDNNSRAATVDGSYLAAEVAGIFCDNDYTWAEPLSGKRITQMTDVQDIFSRADKNNMAANGLMIIEKNSAGAIYIRHALSTDPSTAVTQEFKVIRIQDGLSLYLINNLQSSFINTRNLGAQTIANITATIKFLLTTVIQRNDIVAYQNLQVTQNPTEPREIDVRFQIQPVWDLNWIFIQFGITI